MQRSDETTSSNEQTLPSGTPPRGPSLDGAVLDAFRSKITDRIRARPARTSAPDSPGATMARLRRLSA